MNNIEILNKVEILEVPNWVLLLFVFSSISFAVSFFMWLEEGGTELGIVSIITTITTIVFGILLLFPQPTGEFKYDVRIHDDVSLNEFYEKYEILDKYDYSNVYVVKEKK